MIHAVGKSQDFSVVMASHMLCLKCGAVAVRDQMAEDSDLLLCAPAPDDRRILLVYAYRSCAVRTHPQLQALAAGEVPGHERQQADDDTWGLQAEVPAGRIIALDRAPRHGHKSADGLKGRQDFRFRDKLIQMEINNETTFTMGVGAIALGRQHPSGVWFADNLPAHANKIHVATLPYETKRLCQEIGGGIAETGCLPSYQDFNSPDYGRLIQKYIKAGAGSAESRARIARLIEWLTLGAGVPGCMHGGGSPDGARMVVFATSPLETYVDYARKIGGIREKLQEPGK